MQFALADRHHWPVSLVEEMPESEFQEWLIFLTKIKPEQDRKG